MDKLIQRLAYTRKVEAEYKQELGELQKEIEEKYGSALERVKSLLEVAKADVADAEEDVRRRALKRFDWLGQGQVHPAVTVKMFTVLDYDGNDALEYARLHLPATLRLNKRAFEKVAKVMELDFVKVNKEPRPTISRDLSAYLKINGGTFCDCGMGDASKPELHAKDCATNRAGE